MISSANAPISGLTRDIHVLSPTSSRAITVFNPSLESKDEMLLDWVYTRGDEADTEWSTQLFQLFRKFPLAYGTGMAHPTLLPAVCAYTIYCVGTFDNYCVCEYMQRTSSALRNRLQNPSSIDEGDLFAVSLLAMCSVTESEVISVHVTGVLAIAESLFEKAEGDLSRYSFARFWEMARDEIIRHAWDWNCEKSSETAKVRQLTDTFQRVTDKSIFKGRVEYETDLGGNQTCTRVVRAFASSWQQFLSIETQLHSRLITLAFEGGDIPAMLFGIQSDLFDHFEDGELLLFAFTELTRAVQLRISGQGAMGTNRREARRALVCLVLRQLCRMLLALHDVPCLQRGGIPPTFLSALAGLCSLLQQFKDMVQEIECSTCGCHSNNAEGAKSGKEHPKCELHMIQCSYHRT
jgi:hypothetical protein